MFNQITDSYNKIFKSLRGLGKINDSNIAETIRETRIAMLNADVNFQVVKTFISRVKQKAVGLKVSKSIKPGEYFIKIIHDELISILGRGEKKLKLDKKNSIILLAGLQGSGKTTTAAKLANFLKKNKSVMLIAADHYRPAAIDQLKKIGNQINIDVYSDKSLDPELVIQNGIKFSKKKNVDVVIIDTAGRTHIDQSMMDEIQNISKNINISELLFVADGMSGQDAVNSAKIFNEKLPITGVILTKMDGDSRGGAALSIQETTGKPIKFIGTSEKLDGLEPFDSEKIANRIFGFGNMMSAVEKAQKIFDKEESLVLEKSLINNKFDLDDFRRNLSQISKAGIVNQISNFVPGLRDRGIKFNDREILWTEAILSSMTPFERSNPHLLDGNRRKRISKGSGRPVQEVNLLIKKFNYMKKVMKKFSRNKKNILPILGGIKNFN